MQLVKDGTHLAPAGVLHMEVPHICKAAAAIVAAHQPNLARACAGNGCTAAWAGLNHAAHRYMSSV